MEVDNYQNKTNVLAQIPFPKFAMEWYGKNATDWGKLTDPPGAQQIPADLSEAFRDSVGLFYEWWPGDPEPRVTLGQKLVPISAVCDLVGKFTDGLPEDVFGRLYRDAMDTTRWDLKQELAASRTYATAAYCLRKLIEDKNTK